MELFSGASTRPTTWHASAGPTRNARTNADTKNDMNAKDFRSALRLLTVIFVAFLVGVVIVEILLRV
jgi:hypothetical protein